MQTTICPHTQGKSLKHSYTLTNHQEVPGVKLIPKPQTACYESKATHKRNVQNITGVSDIQILKKIRLHLNTKIASRVLVILPKQLQVGRNVSMALINKI